MLLYVQSSNRISKTDHSLIQQLQFEGVEIHILSEKQLVENPIEVGIT